MPSSTPSDMEDFEEISIMDVYDIVTDFAKEFRPIIDMYGADPLNNIMSKIVTILEHLEAQTVKISHMHNMLQERDAIIARLERDKADKAADRQRFETELEQIEDHWREESHELVSLVNRLQDEKQKLVKALAAKQDSSPVKNPQPLSPEVDIAVLQSSRASIDKLRDQLKEKDKEMTFKVMEIENLSDQIERMTVTNKELRRKMRMIQGQVRSLIDERADFLTQFQDQQYELSEMRQRLGIAEKENQDLTQYRLDKPVALVKSPQTQAHDDPNRPRFTTEELKEILRERNELKNRVAQLEDELQQYRPQAAASIQDDDVKDLDDEDDDAPVQGPLPYEPSDAPWRKSESGIRKLFKKFFSETNMTFLGNSPRRSLSSFSKVSN